MFMMFSCLVVVVVNDLFLFVGSLAFLKDLRTNRRAGMPVSGL